MRLGVTGTVVLARWWWTFVLRGLLAVAFSVLAWLSPEWGIRILVGLFAAWALIDGLTGIYVGLNHRGIARSWWIEILEGLVGIAAAAVALIFPDYAATALVLIIGVWSVITGVAEIVMAIRLRQEIRGEVWLGLAGVASILFGVILVLYPAAGAVSLVWLIGSFALVFGIFLLVLGWRLRTIHEMAKIDAAHDYSR